MPAKALPIAPPEPVSPVRQVTTAKLSERSTTRLTYEISIGHSQTVYLAITDNEGGGSFSRELVPLPHIQAVLAEPLATGASFPTTLLRRAFTSRSNCNGGFLGAALRSEGLLKIGDPPHLHQCAGDWDTWMDNQRHQLAKTGSVGVNAPPAPLPERPKVTKVEPAPAPLGEAGVSTGEDAVAVDDTQEPRQEALTGDASSGAAGDGDGDAAETDQENAPTPTPTPTITDQAPPPGRRPGKAARGTGRGGHAAA